MLIKRQVFLSNLKDPLTFFNEGENVSFDL